MTAIATETSDHDSSDSLDRLVDRLGLAFPLVHLADVSALVAHLFHAFSAGAFDTLEAIGLTERAARYELAAR